MYLSKGLRHYFDGDLDLPSAAKDMSFDIMGHHQGAPVFGPKSFIRMEQTVPATYELGMETKRERGSDDD